jgi:hypothetical protein
MSLGAICLILAFFCFLVAMVNYPPLGRINLVAFGLALWVLSQLVRV